ncbi:PaaI family thioesterase [Vulgatibacter sp.]|uniref:PaaI family thioesterase n=1 Tax=Vulgatibacter sp. TaxID=1971226 RepID=UPI003563AEA1
MERVRTVHWEHPTAHLPEARQLAGIDWLRAIADGSFPAPPIAQLLGFTLATIEPGRVVFALESGEHLYNPIGLVHGGATVATTQGRLEDEAGRLYAHGTGSCLVLRQRGAR